MTGDAIFWTCWGVGFVLTFYFNTISILVMIEKATGSVDEDDRWFAGMVALMSGFVLWPLVFVICLIVRFVLKVGARTGWAWLVLRTPKERAAMRARQQEAEDEARRRDLERWQEFAKANDLVMPEIPGLPVGSGDGS
jgi:Na+-transporting methylmalonyl-CoA/oxaloacetate decarboxylase gamma subunit